MQLPESSRTKKTQTHLELKSDGGSASGNETHQRDEELMMKFNF